MNSKFRIRKKKRFITNQELVLNFVKSKGDGGDVQYDVRGGACLQFWFKSSNFLDACLIRVRNSYNKIKLNFNDL